MRLSKEKLSSYVIQRKKADSLLQIKLFRNTKEKPRTVCHTRRHKTSVGYKRTSTLTTQDQEELYNGKCKPKQLCRSQSLLLRSSTRRNSYINMPVAEIIMKPNLEQGSTSVQTAMEGELGESSTTINKRLCKSTIELSENSLPPASSMLTGTQSKVDLTWARRNLDGCW